MLKCIISIDIVTFVLVLVIVAIVIIIVIVVVVETVAIVDVATIIIIIIVVVFEDIFIAVIIIVVVIVIVVKLWHYHCALSFRLVIAFLLLSILAADLVTDYPSELRIYYFFMLSCNLLSKSCDRKRLYLSRLAWAYLGLPVPVPTTLLYLCTRTSTN